MRSSLGSLKAAWIWLVKAPGVKRPAMEEHPTYLDTNKSWSLFSTDSSSLPCKLKNSPLSLRSTCNDEHIQRILDLHKAQLAAQVMIKATLCLLVIVMYLILEAINYYYYTTCNQKMYTNFHIFRICSC